MTLKTTTRFLGPILAGSLALPSLSATPVRAGSDDTAKLLFGLAALTILGAALADNKSAAAAPVTVHRAPPPVAYPVKPYKPYKPPKVIKRKLPNHCRQTLRISGKTRNVYDRECLFRSVRHLAGLPQNCATKVRIYGRPRVVYMANCLRKNGWSV